MKKLVLLLMLTLIATPVFAHTAKKVKRTTAVNVWSELVRSIDLHAGYRWQPTVAKRHRAAETENQFYVGAGAALPITTTAGLFAVYDRDFTENEDAWQFRAGVAFKPFAGN